MTFIWFITNTDASSAIYAIYANNGSDGNKDANNAIYATCANNAFYTTKPFRPRYWGLVLLRSAQSAPQ
jgi:hypothetical protein